MKTNGRLQLYPFVRVAVFLILGIATGVPLHDVVPVWAWLAAVLVALATFVLARRHCIVQSCLTFLLVFFIGAALGVYHRSRVEITFPDGDVSYRAVITSRPVAKKKTVQCDLTVFGLTDEPFRVKAFFLRDCRAESLRIGQGMVVLSRIKQPQCKDGSRFDYRRYLLFHGYSGTTFILPDRYDGCRVSLDAMPTVAIAKLKALVFREKLLESYVRLGASGQDYAVLSAMTLGDKTAISQDVIDDYSISGAAHVLALSGFHLGIIFTVLTLVFSRLHLRMLRLVLVVLAIWIYVFIVGMSPSVMRSAVMLTVYTFVNLLNRDNFSLNTLSFAAVALLVSDPLDLYDVGFQMSFLSVLAILLLFRPLYGLLPVRWRVVKVVNRVWQMTCVSLTAQLGVAPLVAFYFGRFSCYFLLANFWVIPLATLILYGAVLLVLAAPLPPLQALLAAVLLRLTEWLNFGVSFIASLPGASVDGVRLTVLQTFCCYVVIIAVCVSLLCLRRIRERSCRPYGGVRLS